MTATLTRITTSPELNEALTPGFRAQGPEAGDQCSGQEKARPLRPLREIVYTRIAIFVSVVSTLVASFALAEIVAVRFRDSHTTLAVVELFFALNFGFLMYRIVSFQINRLAFFKRLRSCPELTRDELESVFERQARPLAILVPAYCEEVNVLRMTLMSAALSEYPDRRVVLLIDNPPNPTDGAAQKALAATRELVRELDAMLRKQERRYAAELSWFEERRRLGRLDFDWERRQIATLYRETAKWLEHQASTYEIRDHYDRLYVSRVLREPARAHRERAAQFESAQGAANAPDERRIAREYRRLAAIFAAPTTSFERKRFVNLSHAPNKAMNLNSYIGLIGKSFREVVGPGGLHLEQCAPEASDFTVRGAEYLITLDADSMLLGDYALKLTHIMDQPWAARFAVVQSPFSAVQGSTSILERAAGAQTDVQWFCTQGSTRYRASFWVWANALLRKEALDDIRETVEERGFEVDRYIHDRTLVEDTESTIDLVARGWQVYCHPERLSYTATPADFGALGIQRRRWSNGPVLILPKLAKYLTTGSGKFSRLPETVLRFYTLSAVLASASVLFIITVPFPDGRRFPAFFLMACVLPYYWLFTRDLMNCGYEWWDLPRAHALDLALIPVNLSGLLNSLWQGITGRRSPFVRTPKVAHRTVVAPIFVITLLALLAAVIWWTYLMMRNEGLRYGIYGVLNAVYLSYGIAGYIGLRAGLSDIALHVAHRFQWTREIPKKLAAERDAIATATTGPNTERVLSEAVQ